MQALINQGGENMMKRSIKTVAVFGALLMIPVFGWAHNSSIDIAAPYEGQEFVVDVLPVTVTVTGTIAHSAPPNGANVADSKACVTVDGDTENPSCAAAPVFQGKPPSSYQYSVNVTINSEGAHILQAYTSKTDGGHPGQSELRTIYVYLASVTCDEVDPPAYANQYMNGLNLPQEYAQYRGKVIKQIAHNHDEGKYGTCQYDYELVEVDVDQFLSELGFGQ
jgi:hypothetical protein